MNAFTHPSALRIACRGLADEEVAALRRLLDLLQSHLPQRWTLAGSGDPADMLVVNLDADRVPADPGHGAVVGCALKPRQHPEGTLYRPIRAYQLLSLLTRFGASSKSAGAAVVVESADRDAWRYRLKLWPAQAMNWPAEWWAVMSAIRGLHRTPEEIEVQTGIALGTIRQCLAELSRLDAVDREQAGVDEENAVPPLPASGTRWRALTRRVGQILRPPR
jgi:hypothetical protein